MDAAAWVTEIEKTIKAAVDDGLPVLAGIDLGFRLVEICIKTNEDVVEKLGLVSFTSIRFNMLMRKIHEEAANEIKKERENK